MRGARGMSVDRAELDFSTPVTALGHKFALIQNEDGEVEAADGTIDLIDTAFARFIVELALPFPSQEERSRLWNIVGPQHPDKLLCIAFFRRADNFLVRDKPYLKDGLV